MNEQAKSVQCDEHGEQPATFVCQHIVQGLREGIPYGFYWADDPGNPLPDAWCTICNEAVAAAGGEWTDESEALARVQLLCGACYKRARHVNVGDKYDQ